MGLARKESTHAQSANKPYYYASFVMRSHAVVGMGYAGMDAPSFAFHQEEDITGELTRSMQLALCAPSSPRWAKNFWASEEVRVHAHDRLGKRRLRIDIEIVQHGTAPRPRFRFEAKRLHDARSRSEYLGTNGLGRFLDARYAGEDDTAGMLGYVQDGSVQTQADALNVAMKAAREGCRVKEGGDWSELSLAPDLSTFRSVHHRPSPFPPITMLHTLLLFH
jgi:hypothetical protein